MHSHPLIQRHPSNPLLRPEDLPFKSKLVYNGGVVKVEDGYVMVFRTDRGWDPEKKKAPIFELGLARSKDGVAWSVHPEPILAGDGGELEGIYDPRLTYMENRFHIACAQFTKHGVRGAIYRTLDFKSFEILDQTVPDNRNIVLFPERIGGLYYRLERPFPILSRDGKERFDIWISQSHDLVYWGKSQLLLAVEQVPYANIKLGAGSPPIKTDHGWLLMFHAVDEDPSRGKNGWEDKWQRRYTAGALLLDLHNPRKVIGYSQEPLMVPEAPYETAEGFRYNIVFPCGLIPEPDGTAKIYYGADDTYQCLATCPMEVLLESCGVKPLK